MYLGVARKPENSGSKRGGGRGQRRRGNLAGDGGWGPGVRGGFTIRSLGVSDERVFSGSRRSTPTPPV